MSNEDLVSQDQIDAILNSAGGVTEDERRGASRHAYPTTQLVAPYDDDNAPPDSAYRQTTCYDLSVSGIAFYWPTKPDFERVMIKLGRSPSIIVTGRIVHCKEATEPEQQFLVGCQFTGRMSE